MARALPAAKRPHPRPCPCTPAGAAAAKRPHPRPRPCPRSPRARLRPLDPTVTRPISLLPLTSLLITQDHVFLWRAFHYPNLPVTPTAAAYHLTSYAPPLVRAELVELVADMVVLNTLVPSLSTDADAAASGTGSGTDGRNVDDEETDGSADVWLEPRRFLAAPRVLADQSAVVRLAAAYALEQVRSAPPPSATVQALARPGLTGARGVWHRRWSTSRSASTAPVWRHGACWRSCRPERSRRPSPPRSPGWRLRGPARPPNWPQPSTPSTASALVRAPFRDP